MTTDKPTPELMPYLTTRDGRPIEPEPFSYGLIPYLWLKYVKKQDVHFIGRKGGKA